LLTGVVSGYLSLLLQEGTRTGQVPIHLELSD
jgi:hypothetical protein